MTEDFKFDRTFYELEGVIYGLTNERCLPLLSCNCINGNIRSWKWIYHIKCYLIWEIITLEMPLDYCHKCRKCRWKWEFSIWCILLQWPAQLSSNQANYERIVNYDNKNWHLVWHGTIFLIYSGLVVIVEVLN